LHSVTISRSGSPLILSAANGYRVRILGPGERSWRLAEVEGAYQHGSNILGARLARTTLPLQVAITGSSLSQVQSRESALVSAVSQVVYTVTVNLDGAIYEWRCHPADITPVSAGERGGQGAWDEGQLRLAAPRKVYRLTIPRQPVPIQGAL